MTLKARLFHPCRKSATSTRGLRIALVLIAMMVARPGTAQIVVNTTAQGITSGQCSLQEAIYAAEFGTNKAVSQYFNGKDVTYQTGCTDPTGNWNTIVLQNVTYQFNALWDGDTHNPFGPTATPVIFKPITIQGNGATLQWTGAGYSRLFAIAEVSVNNLDDGTSYSGTGNLTLQDVWVRGFKVHGGNGTCGGGGGMGAGGAIYLGKVSSGTPVLTIVNSTFDGNTATGGSGSDKSNCSVIAFDNTKPGGGGGGLGGNGGGYGADNGGAGGGGGGARGDGGPSNNQGGGGGGGTVFSGGSSDVGGAGGVFCGGNGGDPDSDGHSGSCPGGGAGGGGGNEEVGGAVLFKAPDGANGAYGGGGSGGGSGAGTDPGGNGGSGGFGGGGGASGDCEVSVCPDGGNGGFGGGGALGQSGGGNAGAFAGAGTSGAGGGGAALGGAIFNDSGTVTVQNSTFNQNSVAPGQGPANNGGSDGGAAIFSRNGSLTVQNVTISGNRSNSHGGGITVVNNGASASLTLDNTILANNGGDFECETISSVGTKGAGNLIMTNSGCPGVAVTSDPQVGLLQLNSPGDTPTMAIQNGVSPAVDAGDDATALATDQRGITRPQGAHSDIGAYEAPPPSADLSIAKSVSPSAAQVGQTVTYTLLVTNNGPNTANTVTVSDALPSTLTFVSCSADAGGVCTFSSGTVTVAYSTLASGASSTVSIQTTLNSGVTDGLTIGNSASVSAASPTDLDTSNNSSTAYFTAHNRADLVVTKQASAATVVAGDSFTYTITLSNAGPYDAQNVMLSDTQPGVVSFNSCASTIGSCNVVNGVASLSLASLLNGQNATITINATLNFSAVDGAIVSNTASVTSSTFDPNTANNTGVANVTAQNKSDLFVTKSANLTSVKPLGTLTYTISVKNLGPYRAAAVVMNDPVPSPSTFVSMNANGASCTAPAAGTVGTVSCNFGNLASGAAARVTVTVKINGSTNKASITNTASASSPNFDPNLANNSASVTTQIYGNKK
ncbi:MAG TPA: DUF11 domain-containing protein [Terriglobales bacterium]